MSELTGCELPVSDEPGHCYEVPVCTRRRGS
jgi:hypothetical protein